jgi:hypothetical protein
MARMRATRFHARVTRQLQHRWISLAILLGELWALGPAMIGNVVKDGRLFSLQAAEWLMLIAGGLTGLLILMF